VSPNRSRSSLKLEGADVIKKSRSFHWKSSLADADRQRDCRNKTNRPPQSALVGVAVTGALEIVFDTTTVTRKHANSSYRETCYQAWPGGRDRRAWPNIAYWRIAPVWIRYSDYDRGPLIMERTLA
jgi:hypothetical protein